MKGRWQPCQVGLQALPDGQFSPLRWPAAECNGRSCDPHRHWPGRQLAHMRVHRGSCLVVAARLINHSGNQLRRLHTHAHVHTHVQIHE